jgi:hypothetical protein
MKTILGMLALPCILVLIPTAQAATITGDTIGCATSPSFIFSCSAASAVDGVGIEFTLTDTGGDSLTADFGATGLILTDTAASNQSFTQNFGPGILFNFTDLTNPFTSASFISASSPSSGTGFGAGNLSFSGGTATLSISGITFTGGGKVNVGLTTGSATPEPATAALVGVSLLMGMFWMRSRKRA